MFRVNSNKKHFYAIVYEDEYQSVLDSGFKNGVDYLFDSQSCISMYVSRFSSEVLDEVEVHEMSGRTWTLPRWRLHDRFGLVTLADLDEHYVQEVESVFGFSRFKYQLPVSPSQIIEHNLVPFREG